MIIADIINIGKIKKPKNIELLSTTKAAIKASINIAIIHIRKIFCIYWIVLNSKIG